MVSTLIVLSFISCGESESSIFGNFLCSVYLDSRKAEQRKQQRMFWWDSGPHQKVYMWLNMEALTALTFLDT